MPVCEDIATRSFFRASLAIVVGNGASTLFWSEHWLKGFGIEEIVPDLMVTMPARKRNKIMI
jgi:hypothetical protein